MFILVGVIFFTLSERKVLGAIQLRVGPNKVRYLGLLQRLADAGKLYRKSQGCKVNNTVLYTCAPMLSLLLSLSVWIRVEVNRVTPMFMLYVIMRLSVYSRMLGGWSSHSFYPLIGRFRSVSQRISYELRLFIIFLIYTTISSSFDWNWVANMQHTVWLSTLRLIITTIWLGCILAESRRIPFDFSERESELVSGFNTEFGGIGFTLFFIAEYMTILFISTLTAIVIMGGGGVIGGATKIILVAYFIILTRGVLPRYRYDILISIAWTSYLLFTSLFIAAVIILLKICI